MNAVPFGTVFIPFNCHSFIIKLLKFNAQKVHENLKYGGNISLSDLLMLLYIFQTLIHIDLSSKGTTIVVMHGFSYGTH